MSALTYFFPLSIAAAVTLGACTSTLIETPATIFGVGPAIPAAQVGGICTGVGTSIGDVAAFTKTECAGGLCVADARTGLDTYCSADCEAHSCPTGSTCQAIKLGAAKHACLKDPNFAAADAGGGGMPMLGVDSDDAGPVVEKDAAPSMIGTKNQKGTKEIDVNISSHTSYTCDEACTGAGGTCDTLGGTGAGWVEYKYNDGSGTFGNQIYSCSDPQDYATSGVKLTSMSCFCAGLTIPTTVRVDQGKGTFACQAVCASWSLTCSTSRKSMAFATDEWSSATTLGCSDTPSATAHHYVCACDS